MRTLSGRTVAFLEARKSNELAGMVERLGGTPISAPAVRERPVAGETGPLFERVMAGGFRIAIFLTGAGADALFRDADRRGVLSAVRDALSTMTLVTRGPKPQAALRRQGLIASVVTAKPHTTRELLGALETTNLDRVPLLLLHYGERNQPLEGALRIRGALVEDVCLYEWALPDDLGPMRDLVRRAIAGDVDAVLFTSQIQFRFLVQIAADMGAADELVRALNERIVVGAVGPVCAGALREGKVVADVLPASPNSASLVGAVADYFTLTSR